MAVVLGFTIRVNIVEDAEGLHVHVIKGGCEYRVRLLDDNAELMTMGGRQKTTRAEARRAVRIVADNLEACWREWNKWPNGTHKDASNSAGHRSSAQTR